MQTADVSGDFYAKLHCLLQLVFYLLLPIAAYASTPKVATDIAPVHSLVSQVMEGIASPSLLIPAGASPHEYTLKPSDAKALSEAQVVFWIGESLTPWLEKALSTLADDARKAELLEVEGIQTYEFREGATFEAHDHGASHKGDDHSDEHHDEHTAMKDHQAEKGAHHDDHSDHHDKHAGKKEDHHAEDEEHHDDDHSEHHDHDHHGVDPHAWLDPENAKAWVMEISRILSEADPDNAEQYSSNASKTNDRLDQLIASTQSSLNDSEDLKFIVFHDAYQYFERRFGLSAAGAISLGDAADPSPARIREIQEKVSELGITCAFTEPQYNPGIMKAVFGEGLDVTLGVMDPLGANIPEGIDHYDTLIQQMVHSVQQCKG